MARRPTRSETGAESGPRGAAAAVLVRTDAGDTALEGEKSGCLDVGQQFREGFLGREGLWR